MDPVSRRFVLRSGVVAGAGIVAGSALTAGGAGASGARKSGTSGRTPTTVPVTNGDEALARLKAGNRRYVSGRSLNQGRNLVRRVQEAEGQEPFAVILSCSDSRVSPEVIFDEGIGDLFVVRVAGNTGETPIVQGSIEYAIEHLHSVLIMVLGHQGCGAVNAALESVHDHTTFPGQIGAFVDPIIPAAQSVQNLPADQQMDAAIQKNVSNQVGVLTGLAPILQPEIASGHVKIVGGEYRLKSGLVKILS